MNSTPNTATEIAKAVRSGTLSATEVVTDAVEKIKRFDLGLNCFVVLSEGAALDAARALDVRLEAGEDVGPLAGVPFAVKDLCDVAGEVTHAGSRLRKAALPAAADAPVVARLKEAGAIYLGRLNMDEFAYGFATVNAHFGTTLNPHDPLRLAGGSSGGSAAAVAAGLVPLTLGSDTNGSIRVPASLCGIYGLRPSFGALPIKGIFPFVERLDTVGPFTSSVEDMVTSFQVLRGVEHSSGAPSALKVARLDGWFRQGADPEAIKGVDQLATCFGDTPLIELTLAEVGRSAAFLLTAKAGGMLHFPNLKTNPMAYDPAVRDRLVAGALYPDEAIRAAEKVAARFVTELQTALTEYDLLLAPTTPTFAPKVSDDLIELNGQMVSARANLGLYTQPLSLAGVPILSVPLKRKNSLPLGVQLIAASGREDLLFEAARQLEAAGLIESQLPARYCEVTA